MRAIRRLPPRPRRHVRTYDEVAPVYDRWKWQEFWRRNEAPVVRDLCLREPVVPHALDIGAGTGALAAVLRERADAVVALDASAEMLRQLRGRYPGFTTVQGDAEALPFPAETFDRIGAARLLSHLDDPGDLFRECARVSRLGSALVVTDLHPHFDYEQSTLGFAACSTPFAPTRHPLPRVTHSATAAGFTVEGLWTVSKDDLRWSPPTGAYATLDANDGPVFYVAMFRRH